MKIAFVVSGKSPKTHPGGLGAYAFNTAKILNSLGYKTYIVGFSSKNETFQESDGVEIVHVATPYNKMLSLGLFLITPYIAQAMKQIVETQKPSEVVVYSAGTWGLAGVKLQEALRESSSIKVKTFVGYFSTFDHDSKGQVIGAPFKDYGLWPHLFILGVHWVSKIVFKPLEHNMLKHTDCVVVHYESTRKILLNEVKGLDPQKIIKIPYYIDLYSRTSELKFDKLQCAYDPALPTVSVICRQDPRKGINSFLKAVAILVHERKLKFNCLVVGAGVFAQHNRHLAKKLGLESAVQFLGFVESVEPVLNATDIYVLPSVEEGSGAISLLEAMKKGVAIVTTYCDGIPEDFLPDKTGVLVRMNDPEDLANGLERLITNAEFREKLALAVKQDYKERFQFEKMQQGIIQLLKA